MSFWAWGFMARHRPENLLPRHWHLATPRELLLGALSTGLAGSCVLDLAHEALHAVSFLQSLVSSLQLHDRGQNPVPERQVALLARDRTQVYARMHPLLRSRLMYGIREHASTVLFVGLVFVLDQGNTIY